MSDVLLDETRTPLPLAQVAGRAFNEIVTNSGKLAILHDQEMQEIALDTLEQHFAGSATASLRSFEKVRNLVGVVDMAGVDSKTGLPNNRAFEEQLLKTYARFLRDKQEFAVLMIDVDNFKMINDTYGHVAGDELMAVIAGALQANLRKGDFVARWGGDEFAAILEGKGIEEDNMRKKLIEERLTKINQILNAYVTKRGWVWPGVLEGDLNTHLSVGLCFVGDGKQPSPDQIVGIADNEALLVKKERRTQVTISSVQG